LFENGARRAGRVLGNKSRYHIATIEEAAKRTKTVEPLGKKKEIGVECNKK
jgi:hypothetical protein